MWARTTWRRHFGATMKCCKGDLFQMINSNCLVVCVCSDTEFIWLHARYILMVRFVLFLHSSFLFGNVVHWAMSLKFMDMDIFNCLWWRWLGEVTLILDKTCDFLWMRVWNYEVYTFCLSDRGLWIKEWWSREFNHSDLHSIMKSWQSSDCRGILLCIIVSRLEYIVFGSFILFAFSCQILCYYSTHV